MLFMKNIITILLLILLSSSVNAGVKGNMYCELTKAINGGQLWGLPVLEVELTKTPLLIDLEFRNNFTSPRGHVTSFPNHLSSELNVHIGYKSNTGTWITFSLGGEYNYAGNDFGIPEGMSMKNQLRWGIEF